MLQIRGGRDASSQVKSSQVTLLILIFFASAPAAGEPQFTQAQCQVPASFGNDWHGSAKAITYYIENDFAAEMESCLNNLPNTPGWVADLDEFHVRTSIQHAAEIWNNQSRGMLLKYGGTTTIDAGANACGLGSSTNPAVLVTFEPGCYINGAGNCEPATAHVGQPCEHVTWMRFFGNDTVQSACPVTSQLNSFSIGRSVGSTDLVSVAAHEFGHVLNLGDRPPNAANNTLMDNTILNASDRRHLRGWDQDCVDEAYMNNGRQVYYNWLTLNYLGGSGSFSSHTSPTSRGMLSGGYQWDNSIPYTIYGLFLAGTQSLPNRSIQFGHAIYGYSTLPYSSPFAPATLDTSPVFFRAGEKSYTQEGSRMNYLYRWSTSEDPPRSQTRWSTDIFATNTPNQAQMSGKRGDMPTSLSSHIPSTTAFDPVSGKTIFVHVNTATGNRSIYGDIWVHPGFKEPHFNYTLAEGFRLGAGGVPAMPASPFPTSGTCSPANTCWNYSPKTDVAVGVACGDNTTHFPYNCLLAWQDFSVPTGRVLYTYFRVNTSGGTTVEFHPNAWARGGSQTVSSISAACFAGKYYMAWKKTTAPERVTRNINDSTSYTGWGTPIDHTPTNHLADPPT